MHGPLRYQGLGMPSSFAIQGVLHMDALEDAPPVDGITGRLFSCLAGGLKLEIDLPFEFLQQDYQRITATVTPCWMSNMYEFL